MGLYVKGCSRVEAEGLLLAAVGWRAGCTGVLQFLVPEHALPGADCTGPWPRAEPGRARLSPPVRASTAVTQRRGSSVPCHRVAMAPLASLSPWLPLTTGRASSPGLLIYNVIHSLPLLTCVVLLECQNHSVFSGARCSF